MDYVFEKGLFDEGELEQAIITLFENEHYHYVCGYNLHRKYDEIILEEDLRAYLQKKYADYNLTETEFKSIISRITSGGSHSSLYENSKEMYYIVTEGIDFLRENPDDGSVHIDFMDLNSVSVRL